MGVAVHRGLFRAGRIMEDGVRYQLRRDRDHWLSIHDRTGLESGRVRYLTWRDHLTMRTKHGDVVIVFRPQEAPFLFDNRLYVIGPMEGGDIFVREATRVVVRGFVTPAGVRFEFVSGELQSIQKELALGLALRSEDMSRQFRGPPVGEGGGA